MHPRLRLFAALLGLAAVLLLTACREGPVSRQLPPLDSLQFLGPIPPADGHPVLLEFWATWCPPCRDSIPHLNALHAKLKARVVFIGASSESRDTITAFRKDTPIRYHVALDPNGALARQLGVRGIPRAFLADHTGRIVWEGHPLALTEDLIRDAIR